MADLNGAVGKAKQAEAGARQATNSQWAHWLIRAGYATVGIVYIIIGGLAVLAALGNGGKTTDQKGAVQTINEQPFGKFLLILVAIGLVGYALWSLVRATFDLERKGRDAKGILTRLGYAGSGLSYVGLAILAVQLASGTSSGNQSSDTTAQDWTARLLDQPFGVALVIAVGLFVLGLAGVQFYRAYTAKFQKQLDLGGISRAAREWVLRLGRFGLAARGVVFSLIGIFLILAAVQQKPQEAKGLGGALRELTAQPYGQLLLGLVALGLVAFGLFRLLEARFHRINPA